jgi:membrane-bound metal-dependent hydrolase YbcI (DUF457 family)
VSLHVSARRLVASPVGHAAVGAAAAAVVAHATGTPPSPALWIGAIIASGVPDLDCLLIPFGLKGPKYHRNATHSLLVIGVVLALAILALRATGTAIPGGVLLAWAAALISHPLLDVATSGPTLGRIGWGIPLFWPVSRVRYFSRRPFLVGDRPESVHLTDTLREMGADLIRFGPVCLAVILLGRVFR